MILIGVSFVPKCLLVRKCLFIQFNESFAKAPVFIEPIFVKNNFEFRSKDDPFPYFHRYELVGTVPVAFKAFKGSC